MTTAFSTNKHGTSDALWRSVLDALPAWSPEPRAITVVSPHPDDETLGAGGLIHLCAKLGHSVTIVAITDGELACPEIPELGKRRLLELSASLARLAPNGVRIERLGLPDGSVHESEDALVDVLTQISDRDSLMVSPYEHDGHSDHDATGRAAHRAAMQLGVPHIRYPIWAWHRLNPRDLHELKMRRLPLTDEARAAKSAAIECYVSQTSPRTDGAVVPPHVLEYFRRPYETYFL